MQGNPGWVHGARQAFGGAAVALATLLLTGCVSTAPTPDPTLLTSLTRAPSPSRSDASPTDAKVAFDGKCGAVLSHDAVLGLISDVETEPDDLTIWSETAIPEDEVAGTLTCYWQLPVFGVSARVAPATFAPSATTPGTPEPVACGASPRNERTRVCTTTIRTSGAFVLLSIDFPASERSDPSPATLTAAIEDIANRVDLPPLPSTPGPGWAMSVACEEIGVAIDVTGKLGADARLLPHWDALDAALQRAGYQSDCAWSRAGGLVSSSDFISATVSAGSGDSVAADEYSTPTKIAGATVAFRNETYPFIRASDGVNSFTVSGNDAAAMMTGLLALTSARQ